MHPPPDAARSSQAMSSSEQASFCDRQAAVVTELPRTLFRDIGWTGRDCQQAGRALSIDDDVASYRWMQSTCRSVLFLARCCAGSK